MPEAKSIARYHTRQCVHAARTYLRIEASDVRFPSRGRSHTFKQTAACSPHSTWNACRPELSDPTQVLHHHFFSRTPTTQLQHWHLHNTEHAALSGIGRGQALAVPSPLLVGAQHY
jgi:hypothetical protein